ncbi:MAG TPA: GNAT family N-acetyltransferase [Candidatus Udaeobacter sp.]|nr:GNAT family N-acetyltransferase [Candidatus Udaeobacter sp.]
MTVRPARPADLDRLWALTQVLAKYERLESRVTGSAERLGEHLFGSDTRIECLVAESAGRIVGSAIFFHTYSTFRTQPMMWLEDLIVLPDSRGTGAGRALMVELARIALERGCWRLDWVVLDWNRPSIEFYEHLGAERQNMDWYQYGLDEERLRALARTSSTT